MSGKDFIKAMVRAKDRNEKISIIESYYGYNPNENFGDQEMYAYSKAKLEIKVSQ